MVLVPQGFGGGGGGFGCCGGFCLNASSGASLAKAQSKAALLQLQARNKIAADKARMAAAAAAAAKAATSQSVQPVQQATVPIVQQQPVTVQPTPLQIALQSSSFKCDHSCPVISSQPVLVVSQDHVLCVAVVVVPQSTAQVAPLVSRSVVPVLLVAGIALWLVFY